MGVQLTKDSIDLGIVVRDAEASLQFYRDTLGLEDQGEMPMPGGTMHRLLCGTSLIKLVSLSRAPAASAPPGGIAGATGYRYWTISVSNLDEVTARAEEAGRKVVISPREIRPGIKISMIEDPDGNWVELLQVD
ncbi:MAG: VOC family protein [Acidobacteriota bacterium]|nr:VOC family protein [Acidobacteriota bacterium]